MANPWDEYADASADKAPWEEYAGAAPKPGMLESAARGAAQGASLGFADEAAGALSNLANRLVNPQGDLFDAENYKNVRDSYRAGDKAAKAENPTTFGVGQVAGGAALPVGQLGLLKGAALGAAQGLGTSEADTLGGAAADTALGAGVGGALGAAGNYIGQGISAGLNKFGDAASGALEGIGGLIKRGADTFADSATGSSFGREALDAGAIKLGDSARDIAGRLGEDASEGLRSGVAAKAAELAAKPFFSDLDKTAIGGTLLAGGSHTLPAVGGIVAKNVANARGASTGAVALNEIGDILQRSPQAFGKFAKPLMDAQSRGALPATMYVLQQTNPEFRKLLYGDQNQ